MVWGLTAGTVAGVVGGRLAWLLHRADHDRACSHGGGGVGRCVAAAGPGRPPPHRHGRRGRRPPALAASRGPVRRHRCARRGRPRAAAHPGTARRARGRTRRHGLGRRPDGGGRPGRLAPRRSTCSTRCARPRSPRSGWSWSARRDPRPLRSSTPSRLASWWAVIGPPGSRAAPAIVAPAGLRFARRAVPGRDRPARATPSRPHRVGPRRGCGRRGDRFIGCSWRSVPTSSTSPIGPSSSAPSTSPMTVMLLCLEIAAQMAADRADAIEISLSPRAGPVWRARAACGRPTRTSRAPGAVPRGLRHVAGRRPRDLAIGDQLQPVGLDHAGVVLAHADDDEIGAFIGELTRRDHRRCPGRAHHAACERPAGWPTCWPDCSASGRRERWRA